MEKSQQVVDGNFQAEKSLIRIMNVWTLTEIKSDGEEEEEQEKFTRNRLKYE